MSLRPSHPLSSFRPALRRTISLLVLGGGCLAGAAAFAQDPTPAPADPNAAPPAAAPAATPPAGLDPELIRRIDEIDQRSRIAERKLELADEESAKRAKESALVAAGEKGFTFTSPDKGYAVKIRGLVHADGRFYLDDKQLGTRDTFLIRRARPTLDVTVGNIADLRLMPDFGGGTAVVQDAYADFKLGPWLKLRFGKQKSPVGLERLQSASAIHFVERALPTNVAPNRDIGAVALAEFGGGAVTLAFGVVDGAPDGGSLDLDINRAKDFVGRLFLQPLKGDPYSFFSGLGIGVAGTTGDQKGSATATGLSGYRTAGQQPFFTWLTDARDPRNTVIARKRRTRVSPQLVWYQGPVGIQGEYIWARHGVEKAGTRANLTHQAWQAMASVVLTGDKNTYEGVQVQNPVDFGKGGWGAVEIAGRYNELRFDDDTFPAYANPGASARTAQGFAAALNWHWSRSLTWEVDFERTWFDGGAAEGGDRKTENVLFQRVQFAF